VSEIARALVLLAGAEDILTRVLQTPSPEETCSPFSFRQLSDARAQWQARAEQLQEQWARAELALSRLANGAGGLSREEMVALAAEALRPVPPSSSPQPRRSTSIFAPHAGRQKGRRA
jgi:hypothetical protein